ncbi:hypothetical protein SCWH03_50770 [Streptomyces pacificus]|uniref:Methyltransferase n=1 Tax=Streptomyces pacificus TaxID=2705029 RepID=A0A6A0B119_9ACTN|nr:hypothetical protein SCWH03_50770 [Streptomyces pacificus]
MDGRGVHPQALLRPGRAVGVGGLQRHDLAFRDQDDDPTYTPHLWAYDHEKLVQLFTEAGFTTVEPWTFDPTMANPKRRWSSVYVVATK